MAKSTKLSINAVRMTRCAANGTPAGGHTAGAIVVVGGVGSLKWTGQYQTGDDIAELDGSGGLAVTRKYPDRFKRLDVELDFLVESAEMHELLYGAQLITSAGTVIGYADVVDTACGAASQQNGVIIEAWAEAWQCNQADPSFPYRRVVLARAFFTPSDGGIERSVNHFNLKGFAQPNSNFGDGPFNDLAAVVALGGNWVRAEFRDTTLPTDSNGLYTTTPSQS